jgi:hypothetical protein
VSESAVSEILARVVCSIHDRTMGVVKLNQRGYPSYSSSDPGIYARHLRALNSRDTAGWHLRDDYGDNHGEVLAWCRNCGGEARQVPISELLAAVDGRRSKRIPV